MSCYDDGPTASFLACGEDLSEVLEEAHTLVKVAFIDFDEDSSWTSCSEGLVQATSTKHKSPQESSEAAIQFSTSQSLPGMSYKSSVDTAIATRRKSGPEAIARNVEFARSANNR